MASRRDPGPPTSSALQDIRHWRTGLGLLPVPLFGDSRERQAYVLLNGSRGNFCLDLGERRPDAVTRSEAWSSNVGHYVSFEGDDVLIQRWDRPEIDRVRSSEVQDHLERFHQLLETDAPHSDLSIVAHALRIFRSLRAALGESYEGTAALQGFLCLLAAALEDAEPRSLSLEKWQLDPEGRDAVLSLPGNAWDSLLRHLIEGRPIDRLKPDLTLVLRHASGVLFQEAHYAAVFDTSGQLLLEGFTPTPVAVHAETAAVGLHFTPPALARALVEESIAALEELPVKLTVFDPACGSGEFLREALRQLELRGYPGAIRLVGFDISPAACAMAKFILAWEARGMGGRVSWEIGCRDALTEGEWPAAVDLLLMNPPFLSWPDMSPAQQASVREILGSNARRRPDLSTAFLWRAAGSLASRSVLGSILPASFLDGEGFAAVRAELGERLATRLVARLGSHGLFHEARIDAAFYVAGRGMAADAPLAVWADHRPSSTSAALRTLRRMRALGAVSGPVVQEGFSVYRNEEIGHGGGKWAPRPYRQWTLQQRVRTLPPVSATFSVQQGTITGFNRVFLISAAEWRGLPEPERHYFRPCVLNESIRGGKLYREAYVFYPYGDAAIADEPALEAAVPTYYRDRLAPQKEPLRRRQRVRQDRWWLLAEHRAWQVHPTRKIVSAYFGDEGSFAWDEAGDFVVVQGYGWLPRPQRGLGRPAWLAYLALLNGPVFQSLLAASSNHVGGGQWNLSKRFVEPIPLPSLADETRDPLLDELASLGELIHERGLDKLTPEERQALSELAEAVYGVAEPG